MEVYTFQEKRRQVLRRIDPGLCECTPPKFCAEIYHDLENYAMERRMWNTCLALPIVQKMVFITGGLADSPFADCAAQLQHSLEMSRLLIDLHIPLDSHEEDILLATALCHILPENSKIDRIASANGQGIQPEVFEVLRLIRRVDFLDPEKRTLFMERVQGNRLALIMRVADQGNFVEQIHRFSGWRTHQYIYETRNIYLPMCIYAKEHYPELIAPISILMEKMRSLIEVAEILQSRYESRQIELNQEIFALREENARIKELIRTIRAER